MEGTETGPADRPVSLSRAGVVKRLPICMTACYRDPVTERPVDLTDPRRLLLAKILYGLSRPAADGAVPEPAPGGRAAAGCDQPRPDGRGDAAGPGADRHLAVLWVPAVDVVHMFPGVVRRAGAGDCAGTARGVDCCRSRMLCQECQRRAGGAEGAGRGEKGRGAGAAGGAGGAGNGGTKTGAEGGGIKGRLERVQWASWSSVAAAVETWRMTKVNLII